MSMDPNAALWTIALYAGEPDPLDLWEMDDGTPVDIGACVLALAGALGEVEVEAERLQAERAAAFLVANQAGETARLALLEAERLRGELAGRDQNIAAYKRRISSLRGERDQLAQSYSLMTEHRDQLRGERDAKVEEIEGFWRPTRDAARRLAVEYIEKNARARIGTHADTAEEIAEARGWGYLYGEADAPEGQPKLSRRLADLGAADLWRPFRVALLGSDTVHTWKYQGRFEESFGGVEVAWRFLDEDGEHHNLHHPDWRLCPAPAPETKTVAAILGKLPSDETDAEFLDMLEGEQP